MKILLTGATGFVGSHILDALCERGLPIAVLLRRSSQTRFIEPRLRQVELRYGALSDSASLDAALDGVTHVIHCAGLTRALRKDDFDQGNHLGTRRLVEAVNRRPGLVQRFLHISSLAASRPATAEAPAREDEPSAPISAYGRSKLAGELAVRQGCRAPWVVLRPPAVYGPRDDGFLSMFQAVRVGIIPRFVGGIAALSMIYVTDLAQATLVALEHPAALGRIYHAASPEVLHGEAFACEVARQMGRRALNLPLPVQVFWPVCLFAEIFAKLTRKPQVLGLQKYPELSAPGWVCDTSKIEKELGFRARTPLPEGISATYRWYREAGWL